MSNAELHIVAERVAEVVNRRLAEFNKRIDSLESRITKLELDVSTLRSQAIESIVRSILTIKLEGLATAIATAVASKYSNLGKDLMAVTERFNTLVEEIKVTVNELKDLKALPKEVADAVSKTEPKVELDTSQIEKTVVNAITKSLKNVNKLEKRVETLEKKVDDLSGIIVKLSDSIAKLAASVAKLENMGKTITEMKESVDYSREVLSILEERLKRSPAEEEEE